MKKKLLILSLLAICIATLAAGSLAYFTANGTAHNVITTGGVAIELHEWADEDKTKPFEDLTDVMPGTAVTKLAEVENTGANDVWVRVKLDVAVLLDGEKLSTEPVELDINTDDWTRGEDGYYYYKSILKADETTAPIFTTVSFASGMGNEYQNATATVDVSAEAVQSANNGETVMDAVGWPQSAPSGTTEVTA